MILETTQLFTQHSDAAIPDHSQIKCIALKKYGKKIDLPLTLLTHIEALSNYSIIHTADGHKYISSKTLKYWNTLFVDHFLRCHQSFLLNQLYVDQVNRKEIQLTNGVVIPCSRRLYRKMMLPQ